MSLKTMYLSKNNSPKTTLTTAITSEDTALILADASVLPAAPNLLVLGTGENAEIASYTTIAGNVVSGLVRGVNGTTPGAWPVDTIVARNFTTYDADTFRENILDLENRKAESNHNHDDRYYTEEEADDLLADKSDLDNIAVPFDATQPFSKGDYVTYDGTIYRFNTNHAAGDWNSGEVTAIVIAEVLKENQTELDNILTQFGLVYYNNGVYVNPDQE